MTVNTRNSQIENDITEGGLGDLDIHRLTKALRRSLPYIILVIILGLGTSFFYLRYTVDIYESSSILKLEVKSDVNALGLKGMGDQSAFSSNLSGEMELIKSDLIYNQVLDTLDALQISYLTKGRLKDEERFESSFYEVILHDLEEKFFDRPFAIKFLDEGHYSIKLAEDVLPFKDSYAFGEEIRLNGLHLIIRKTVSNISPFASEDFYFIVNSRNALLNKVKSNLEVQILNPRANTLKIIYRDPNPVKARAIVSAINQIYLSNTLEIKLKASKQTINFLDQQLNKTEQKLRDSEKELEAFIQSNKTNNIDAVFGLIVSKMESVKAELNKNQAELKLINQLQNSLKNDQLDSTTIQTIPFISELSFTKKLEELISQKTAFDKLKHSTNSQTLAYQYAKDEYQNSQANLQNGIEKEIEFRHQNIKNLNSDLKKIEFEFSRLPSKETEFNRLKRYYDLNEKFYLLLMDKKAEFGISEAGTIPDFQVLSPAVIPQNPVAPDKVLVYAIGIGSSFIVSLLIIFLFFISHNTIDSLEELERLTDTPVLGIVPQYRNKMKLSKLLVNDNPKSEISEAIRAIRTNLDFIAIKGHKKTISISSTIGGEGKTFVTVNLGGIISMANQKVVLLDLDMRKPKLHIALGGENDRGMSNLLIDNATIEDVICHTSEPNLDYIASGPPPPNPSELIMLPKMNEILEQLKKRYDAIIIDSPPTGLVTDGILLMKNVDIPIYVLRAEYSKKSFVKSLSKLKNQSGVTNLSLVLNGVKRNGTNNYGYGYGYYEEKKPKSFLARFF